jgi:putative FmdB family regulatory protein
MPLYDLQCRSCGETVEQHIPLSDFDKPLAPCECGGERFRAIRPLRVISDIEPYQAMGTDIATGKAPMITSRSQHREYLKRNGYVEVGNERPTPPRPLEPDFHEIGRTIKKVMDDKGITS